MRVLRDAAVALAMADGVPAVVDGVRKAAMALRPDRGEFEIWLAAGHRPSPVVSDHSQAGVPALVPVTARGEPGGVGALLADPATAARVGTRLELETLSAQAAIALCRMDRCDQPAAVAAVAREGALVEHTADVILIVDDDNRIRYASPSARTVFGTSALRDVALPDLVEQVERRPAEQLLRHARTEPQAGRADWTIRSSDGTTVLVEVACRDLRSDESVGGVVVTLRDVTAQRRLEHELTDRVFHDPLTGLPNRRLFSERVNQSLASRARPAAVIYIDLTDFNVVNEAFGHEVGDAVLIAVGQRLHELAGTNGMAARVDGDEFALLVLDPAAVAALHQVVARIVAELEVPLPVGAHLVRCGANAGAASTASAGAAQELLRHADLALHAAKAAGDRHWRCYEPSMTETVRYRLELRSALNRCLDDDSLLLEYQPIVALDTGATVGFEALLRWWHPTRGLVAPGEFIDLAEESGLIEPIGAWVLQTAMAAAARWAADARSGPPYVSVNVSPRQFRATGFIDSVLRLLVTTGLPATRLVLEITEGLLLRDDDAVWEALQRLRRSGIRVAIDDFGTGYSALGYLRQVPLDIVKLDRVFTATMTTSVRQRELVEGIVGLTRALRLDVVVEGIETTHQRDVSAAIGCAYGQGFLFARPMPEADTTRWLARVVHDSTG